MGRLKYRRSGRASCGYDERGLCVAPFSSEDLEFIFADLTEILGQLQKSLTPVPRGWVLVEFNSPPSRNWNSSRWFVDPSGSGLRGWRLPTAGLEPEDRKANLPEVSLHLELVKKKRI